MILLIEPDKEIRKRLGDLLSKERIICVGNATETMEMICKFKNKFDLIIANVRFLRAVVVQDKLTKLCQKLYIEIPPIVGYCIKEDREFKEEFEKIYKGYTFIEYDEKDTTFPDQYIKVVRKLYPGVIVNAGKANQSWQKPEPSAELADLRAWLEKEGFVSVAEKSKYEEAKEALRDILPAMENILSDGDVEKKKEVQTSEENIDYREKYLALKKKYDMLLEYAKAWSVLMKKLGHTI
jgi:hypothetical protein